MTTNQAIAMAFPLFTAALAGVTALVMRWVWKAPEEKPMPNAVEQDLRQAQYLIDHAQRELRTARSHQVS
jgi:beta-lactam-binding protein with PASTA domain